MQTRMEETGKHKVKLTIEVPEDEFRPDLDAAYRRIAQQVRVPGFRKGRVPKKIIDAQVGRDKVVEEFLNHAVPDYYREAVRERDLAPITDPDLSLDQVEVAEGRPLVFSAEIEVRPRLELDDYRGVQVERPRAESTDAEVDQLLERLRERFAELETVGRPAQTGDYVVADVRAALQGEELPEATRPDYLYPVGTGEFGSKLDEELLGRRAGEILKFADALPERFGELSGTQVSFTVLLKEVKGRKLPPIDDDLAKTASEFDTLDELREDLRETIGESKQLQADGVVRDRVLATLIDRVEVDLPDTLIDEEIQQRVEHARQRAERAGSSLEAALESQGWDELRLRADARNHAVRAIKSDLVLEAVARREGLEVTAEEIGREIATLAARLGRDPEEVAKTLDRAGQIVTLAGDIIRTKALDALVEHASITQEGDDSAPERAAQEVQAAVDQGTSEQPAPTDQGSPSEAEASEEPVKEPS